MTLTKNIAPKMFGAKPCSNSIFNPPPPPQNTHMQHTHIYKIPYKKLQTQE